MIEHLYSAGTAAREAVSADWDRIVWAWGAGEFSVAWVLGAVGGIVGFFYAVLSNDRNYAAVRNFCRRDSPRRLWRRIVLIGLRRLSRWFGPSWSFKAFDRSLPLALVYPVLVILIAWALGGPFRLGLEGADADFSSVPTWFRWATLIALSVLMAAQVYWIRLVGSAERRIEARIDRWEATLNRTKRDRVAVLMVRTFVAFGAVGAVGAVVAVVAFGAFGAVGAVGGVVALFVPLYVVAPVLNGIFDFLSWLASRRLFLRLTRREMTTGRLLRLTVWHVALDVGLAIVFLIGLAVFLPAGMALYSHGILDVGGEAGFPWRDYLDAAVAEPWGVGLAVTAMLVTTLVPTLLHAAAAGFALVLPAIGHLWPDETVDPDPIHRLGYAVSTAASVLASLVLLLVLGVAIHAFITAVFGGFDTSLAAMAEASGAWVETWFTHAP
jgi:hypothetical protein